jgi:hypothetical protein
VIDWFPSSKKLQKDHTKAVHITLLGQLASHCISVPNSAKTRVVRKKQCLRYFNSSCEGQKELFLQQYRYRNVMLSWPVMVLIYM